MLGAIVFVGVLVLVFAGLFSLRLRQHRRWMKMTPEERDRYDESVRPGVSTTAPLVNWIRRRRR